MLISEILEKEILERDDIIQLLRTTDPSEMESLRAAAESVLLSKCGPDVFYRGLIEFSNVCASDCLYCGIRKSSADVKRFTLKLEEILAAARWCAEQGYGSVVLQSGERRDKAFIELIEEAVKEVKSATVSEELPQGLGITLCVGEQSPDVYERFFNAGAHRYLLRIESSNPDLFAKIHPPAQRLESRIECLKSLKKVGFQVGTGVMIGLPGQTIENLADDVLFFRDMDVDMIGMGPYIVHSGTPMSIHADYFNQNKESIFTSALKMIAVCRLVLKDVNIAATTALQAMKHDGREQGLRHGANIIMPQLTPVSVRQDYLLYEGKPCLDESAEQCRFCLERRILSVGRRVALNGWGDSRHFKK